MDTCLSYNEGTKEVKLVKYKKGYKIFDNQNTETDNLFFLSQEVAVNKFNEYVQQLSKETKNDAQAHV